MVTFLVVESVVFALAALPATLFWSYHWSWPIRPEWMRAVVLGMVAVPTYVLFAGTLMAASAIAARLTGWLTPVDREMRIADLEWPLLAWGRYMALTHVVRVFAGTFFRGTPVWTWYLRMNGATLGRRVYVNSLAVIDHNLLTFGDGVVIGDDVHLSGHTVEGGVVKTARVELGDGVGVGLGSVVGIGVRAAPGAQIGALSLVPKFSELEAGAVYAGIPVRRIDR